jgi:IS30 family transposase
MTYTHISQTERYQILGRHKSKISREISRGCGRRGYRPRKAQNLSYERSQGSRNAREVDEQIVLEVRSLLALQWSPEQIASQLTISHETIYYKIYAEKAQGGHLWRSLRCQKKRRKRYASGHDRRGQISDRRSISERSDLIERRSHISHWEADTVIGAVHQHAILRLVERKSGYAVVCKVNRKTSDQVSAAIVKRLKPLVSRVKMITYDNGKEFAEHKFIDALIGSMSYFADPFASWQRGMNENYNGLLRQYIPKKRRLSTVTDEELKMINDRLNHRPRKRLRFKTPHQVFHESLSHVVLRT